uniref:PIPK domain-containing protein n=1 Tax=Rousettus aegyptiacus TaxID=9407 RepID=A0A7J8BFG2_ROUAE|nr:hypothetical protein HJG63_009835 [Rousettus aegyptiacus]
MASASSGPSAVGFSSADSGAPACPLPSVPGGKRSMTSEAPCASGMPIKKIGHRGVDSTAMESIQGEARRGGTIETHDHMGGIPARNSKGERLLLYIGIIDILQSYRFIKKLEHSWKALVHDGDTVSVHRPSFYAERFQRFMCSTVFKKIPLHPFWKSLKSKSQSVPTGAEVQRGQLCLFSRQSGSYEAGERPLKLVGAADFCLGGWGSVILPISRSCSPRLILLLSGE